MEDNKMKNKLYKLLVIKEQDGNWKKYLENLFLTVMACDDSKSDLFYFLGRLASLQYLDMIYFRATIFDLINMVDRLELKPCLKETIKP